MDYYTLSVHEGGSIIRKITCNEDTIGVEKEGEAFLFEESIFQDDEDNQFFDYEDMYDYCLHFGFDLLTDPSENDGEWTIIKVKE